MVDTATASFTTDEEPYTGPAPWISFDFGGSTSTNFRMTYTGLTSIRVEIDIANATDVDHSRSSLDPSQTYNHTATRRTAGLLPVGLGVINGFRVTASGPGGTISVNYGDFGVFGETVNAYRARGWTAGDDPAALTLRRTFGPGSYT